MSTLQVQPADVLAVATKTGLSTKLIDIGEILRGKIGLNNHVVVVHHQTNGVWWGLEGKPGGVGWADLTNYLRDPRTTSNVHQPKELADRSWVVTQAEVMLGRAYDWDAIMTDTLMSLGIHNLFSEDWHGTGVPGHVVCSSFAAYLYSVRKMPRPSGGGGRFIMPADWTDFNLNRRWMEWTDATPTA
jgi:hypothetical protein